MTSTPTPTEPQPDTTSRAPVIGALVLLGLVLVIAFGSWLVRDDQMYSGSPKPTATSGADPQAVTLALPARESGRCMPVDAQTLGRAETAFDGEVLRVDGDTVTLAVRQWYAGGGDAAQVQLDLAKVPSSLTGYFAFEKERRYLVAANDDTVMVCGFSAPWSADLEKIYRDAFAGS
jgi:hypothetical protein